MSAFTTEEVEGIPAVQVLGYRTMMLLLAPFAANEYNNMFNRPNGLGYEAKAIGFALRKSSNC